VVVRTTPVLVLVILLAAAGCSMRDATVPDPAGPAGNLTDVPVPVIPNVRYVDSVGQNFLFRGAHPVTERAGSSQKFDEEALQSAIRNASREAGRELPENFTLIDISLLWAENPEDNNRERALLRAEDAFFTSRPERGRLHMWPMHGTELDPADPSAAAHREYLAEHLDEWLPDPLIGRVDTVRKYLEDPAAEGVSGPVVVYVHCYGGCDRTGELIGAYSLRYLNLTWEEARDLNGKRCRPDRGYDKANCNALQWYGIWLNRTEGRPINWDADPPCYRPGS
jgi:hypothetical protein